MIGDWLTSLGLSRLGPTFRANDIDLDVVKSLTDDDLTELGLTVGDRKRVLAATSTLAFAAAPLQPIAERRSVTVLFCDLVSSTALSARLDPEDMREVIHIYRSACTNVVARHEGFVAKFMCDRLLVYFGYPRAHEGEAERAVRAALDIVAAVARLRTPAREPLVVRIGIATGLVVVGDLIGEGTAKESSVVGDTPNLAARLQIVAEPNAVVIDKATRLQVGALFELIDLGPQTLKGFGSGQPAWRVRGSNDAANRFKALRPDRLPLVGRNKEMEILSEHWADAKSGRGRVVLLSGEAGMGKSRLVEAARERIRGDRHVTLRYFCSPHHQQCAFHPVIGQLERAADFERSDDAMARRYKLINMLAGRSFEADLPLLAELLSVPGIETSPVPELTPNRRKQKIIDALDRLLEDVVRSRPVLVIFEDLHWIDPASREFLDRVISRVARTPVLLIATFRPEFHQSWVDQPHVSTVFLSKLGPPTAAALVREVVGAGALPLDIVNEIIERSDGVPLYLEEMARAVVEAGCAQAKSAPGGGARITVPMSLQASLMERLDRLGPAARDVARTASAIGRELPYDLIVAASQLSEAETRIGLDELVSAGMMFQTGTPPTAVYEFKHSLVQDTAYSTLLRGSRRALHARLAAYLERRLLQTGSGEPEIIAHHFAEARRSEVAPRC
jgi:class 3 adenylate cyclase